MLEQKKAKELKRLFESTRQASKHAHERFEELIMYIDQLIVLPEVSQQRATDKLTGQQHKRLEQALVSAFPSYGKLTRMVRHQLDQSLVEIVGGKHDALSEVVFNLINWAEAEGRIRELIMKARDANPGNLALRDFVNWYFDYTTQTYQ